MEFAKSPCNRYFNIYLVSFSSIFFSITRTTTTKARIIGCQPTIRRISRKQGQFNLSQPRDLIKVTQLPQAVYTPIHFAILIKASRAVKPIPTSRNGFCTRKDYIIRLLTGLKLQRASSQCRLQFNAMNGTDNNVTDDAWCCTATYWIRVNYTNFDYAMLVMTTKGKQYLAIPSYSLGATLLLTDAFHFDG